MKLPRWLWPRSYRCARCGRYIDVVGFHFEPDAGSPVHDDCEEAA